MGEIMRLPDTELRNNKRNGKRRNQKQTICFMVKKQQHKLKKKGTKWTGSVLHQKR